MRKQNEIKDKIKQHQKALKTSAKNLITQPISFIHGNAKTIMYNRYCIEALNDAIITIQNMHELSTTLSDAKGEKITPSYEDFFNHRLACIIKHAVKYAAINDDNISIKTRAYANTIEWLSGKLITDLYMMALEYHSKNFEVVYNL